MEVENWYKAGWKINHNDEASYIEIEDDDEVVENVNENQEESCWQNLPDLLLEEIFNYLNLRERYYVSMVCKNWYRVFYFPNVWQNYLVEDDTLARRKFNYYSGYQPVLDHMRTQNFLAKVGRFIKGLDFQPTYNFNNMYQFMTLLTYYIEQSRNEECQNEYFEVGHRITSLTYHFPCNMAFNDDPEQMKLFGTGGQLLSTLKDLLSQLTKLKTLKLFDLNLERYEANHLLDEVIESCGTVIKNLHLVNPTLKHCPIMHVGLFFNLETLVISPQNIDDDVLQLLTSTRLRHFYILQNKYTPAGYKKSPCSAKAWKMLKQSNPNILVHLRVESLKDAEVLLQPEAPVYSITYQTPKTKVSYENILQILDMYKFHLNMYGHELIPTFEAPKLFDDRCDNSYMLLARNCPNLSALMIREHVSTSTLLLLAKTAINLRLFYVRRNAVIIDCDWPQNPEWSDEFYSWLQASSESIEATEKEISQILGYRWTLLSDEQFQKVKISVTCTL